MYDTLHCIMMILSSPGEMRLIILDLRYIYMPYTIYVFWLDDVDNFGWSLFLHKVSGMKLIMLDNILNLLSRWPSIFET